jgi:sialate O-acetylesterase
MKTTLTSVCIFFIIVFSNINLYAEDLRKVISLSGYWKFSIGDDKQWADPAYNDASWDQINVPDKWEECGYDEYNGYAWYRKTFNAGNLPKGQLYLLLGRIDDADVVYLNGKALGRSGSFPPYYQTAYDRKRKYALPEGLLNENGSNTIAIKIYDTYQDGGIVEGPVGIFYDADIEYLNLNLTGKWKIHTGDNSDWQSPEFKDDDWKRIYVPSVWENTVLGEYDGYAWYRVKFKVPADFVQGDLYLCLGKIDDIDDVYLNGKFIGDVYDLKKDGDYRRSGWEFNARRIYKIDRGLLKNGTINHLAVRVYDGQGEGGIYEGPVGIMSEDNFKRYRKKYYSSQPFWDYIFDSFYFD